MFGSIYEAAAREQHNDRLARAAAARRVAELAAGSQPARAGLRMHSRRAAHPVQSFHRWLAAGQL